MKSIIRGLFSSEKQKLNIEYKFDNNGKTVTAFLNSSERINLGYFVNEHAKIQIRSRIPEIFNYYFGYAIDVNEIKGVARYNPEDTYIKGMSQKIARRRLIINLYRCILRALADYHDILIDQINNVDNVILAANKQYEGAKQREIKLLNSLDQQQTK